MLWPLAKRTSAHVSSPDEALLRELLPDVRAWVARYVGPRPELDDIVQEAMIELVAALPRFRGDCSVRTYAHRVAIRTAAHQMKRIRRHRAPLSEAEPEERDARDPERLTISRECVRRFYDALAQLSAKRRDAFVLCAIEKMPHEEAARTLDVSIETLRARLRHARADLSAICARDPALARFVGGET